MSDTSVPDVLVCPVCRSLYRNPVMLPCCRTTACKCCALQKLLVKIFFLQRFGKNLHLVIQWKGFCKSIMNFFIIVKHPQLRPFKTSSTLLKMQILIIARNETNCKLFKVVVWLWNMLTFWIGTQLQIYRRDRYEGKNKENHYRYEGKPKKWHLRSETGHHSKFVDWY